MAKDTSIYMTMDGNCYCSYCHSYAEMKDEWNGSGYDFYYQCDCEKAKIQIEMNKEISVLEDQIKQIKEKYKLLLTIDEDTMKRNQFKIETELLKQKYSIEE